MAFECSGKAFIKVYRKFLEWEWYSDVNTSRLFIHCLLKANWKPAKWKGQTIEAGQFVTSLANLADETGLTVQQVRTALEHLISTGEVTNKSQSKYRIITVNNWNCYQEDNRVDNKQITNNQQTNNKQITNNQQHKNKNNTNNTNKKEKNNIYIVEILDHLNMRTGQNYKSTTQKTKDLINARFNEKFTVDDFKTVIDKMCVEWMNTDMQKYLRPETLFGNKFESYLNREVKPTTKNITLSEEKINELFG